MQAVKAAEDAAIQAAQAAQQAEAGGNPVDVVAKATLATTRCSQVDCTCSSLGSSPFTRELLKTPGSHLLLGGHAFKALPSRHSAANVR